MVAATEPVQTMARETGATDSQARREAAVEFLQAAATDQVRHASETHVAPDFIHHNPWFEGTAEALLAGMEQNAKENPGKELEVLRTLADGDLVAVHSRVRMKRGAPWHALVHIFRFEGDRIVELWDISQEMPADSPNRHGMF